MFLYPNRITVFIICDTGRTCNFFLSGGRKILRGSSGNRGRFSVPSKLRPEIQRTVCRKGTENRPLFPKEKNGTGVSGGTSNGQKTKDKEKKIQNINTIYRTVTQ